MSTTKTIMENKEILSDRDVMGKNTNEEGAGKTGTAVTYPYNLTISTYKPLANAGVTCYFDVGNIVPISLETDNKGKISCNLPAERIYSIDVDYKGTHYKNNSPIESKKEQQNIRVVELT